MRNEKIRFGIIGTSKITDEFLKASKKVKDFNLNAIYSRKEETAKEFALKYEVKNIFTNIEEMAKSDLIDAVYIASPNAFHYEQAKIFLSNKKHVFCEKSMASNSKEIAEMIDIAKKNNVLLMEGMKTTLMPNFLRIKENLYKIGKIRRYFASYCQYSSRYDKYKEGIVLNAFKRELSNGATMDIGVYCIYPMICLFGLPKEIKANNFMLESGVDGQGSAILKYDDMDGIIIYSKIANSYLPSEIQGEDGSIIIDNIHNMSNITIKYRDGKSEVISTEQVEENMMYEIEEFVNLINTNLFESKINSYENSLNTSKVMEEIRKQMGLVYPADLEELFKN
ncbi:Gfo/Idh/MocA family protein [Clostridium saccharobutylicum]|uniref:Oxidoreductase YulF n=1 Tax=Clostridium saccharobutylicum DSM 13864 TaxID=1345695 RepID=U5MUE7_CLOSA|nr:Gfo/Idh/MocA family oxidoreductase [Clostridium saccharobutylicum]AGX44158.1 oxidoreductase YulF [Clostridium saccharobutylicum DSM 13864]AQR91446.1 1,5-anhydro-D-fructose reductase [Clostridium saccharobutylicum]AQS01350.1 1,5-anhydro-D-fructose reductase [Clostridium saccharobutylicum]AQS10958.1 1,5-anhydro-D-fructose reductase [Clostridium saccharobutylicum]AQS15333.1 1,5-anhydro-D-fructose reductase [Clostridium saccharobutylicum]